MHDCRTMESRLVDLAFGELKADEKMRLLAELERCAGCLNEYQSMACSLDVFDKAFEAPLPHESYWEEHRAKLRHSLERIGSDVGPRRDTFWKRIFAARLPVPVPVAAVIVIALLVSSVLALRLSTGEVMTTAQQPIVAPLTPTVIEVPVFREKVITRTVYVEKKVREKNEAPCLAPIIKRNESALTARNEEESGQGGFFTRANLTDFQPADELRIRIIKRSSSDEN